MFGLMFILVYGTCLFVIPAVLGIAVWRWAIKRGKPRAWSWGVAAALAIPVWAFWDYYPTKWAHEYYCKKEAGFWVYKTLDRWKAENPGDIETLSSQRVWPPRHDHVGDMENYVSTDLINLRFNAVLKKNGPFLFNRWRWEQEIVDSKTNEVLARSVDFSTGNGYLGSAVLSPKFWLQHDECIEGENNGIKLGQFSSQFTETKK